MRRRRPHPIPRVPAVAAGAVDAALAAAAVDLTVAAAALGVAVATAALGIADAAARSASISQPKRGAAQSRLLGCKKRRQPRCRESPCSLA